jgi:hypothetical protein
LFVSRIHQTPLGLLDTNGFNIPGETRRCFPNPSVFKIII